MNCLKVCSILLLASAVDVCAAEAGPPPPALVGFQSVDANHDGKVSLEEAKAVADLQAEFGRLDLNHDDVLTPVEFSRWSRAAEVRDALPSPSTGPSGSNGSQHMPAGG